MRIVHVPNLYAPSVGGVQTLVRVLSEAFASGGDDVSVFTANAIDASAFYVDDPTRRAEPRREAQNGVSIRRFPIHHRLHTLLFDTLSSRLGAVSPRARHALESRPWHRAFRKRPFCPGLAAALIRSRPDLAVAFNSASSFTISCWLAKAVTRTPYVVFPTLHTTSKWAHDPLIVPVLQHADAVVVATRFERDHLVDRGVDPRAIEIVPLGIDLSSGRGTGRSEAKRVLGLDDEPVIGFVGRQVEGKGIRTLIRAMRHVWARRPATQLLLAGRAEPSFAAPLAAELAELHAVERARVVTIGEFPETRATDVHAACDIFAMPSTVESFGIGYLEAWRQRTPVVAATGGAPASFIRDGVDGLLVAPGDAGSLADALLRLLGEPALSNRLGDAGYARLVEDFNAALMIERVRQIYDDVLRRRQAVTFRDTRPAVRSTRSSS